MALKINLSKSSSLSSFSDLSSQMCYDSSQNEGELSFSTIEAENEKNFQNFKSQIISSSTRLRFKQLIEKQKKYVHCLKKELERLKKLEKIFIQYHQTKMCQKTKQNNQSKLALDDKKFRNFESKSKNLMISKELLKISSDNFEEKNNILPSASQEYLENSPHQSFETFASCSICKQCLSSKKKEKPHLIKSKTMILKKNSKFNSIGIQTSPNLFQRLDSKFVQYLNSHQTQEKFVKPKFQSNFWCISPPRNNHFKFFSHSNSEPSHLEPMSLQQAFKQMCPQILNRSKARTCQIQIKSEIRKRLLNFQLESNMDNFKANDQMIESKKNKHDVIVVCPRKVLTEKEMKRITEKRYSHLPEIQQKAEVQKRQKNLKTHRLMAKIFSNRLKKKALQGHTSIPITQTIQLF